MQRARERAMDRASESVRASQRTHMHACVRACTHARARAALFESERQAQKNTITNTIKITIKNTITNTQYIYFTFSLQKRYKYNIWRPNVDDDDNDVQRTSRRCNATTRRRRDTRPNLYACITRELYRVIKILKRHSLTINRIIKWDFRVKENVQRESLQMQICNALYKI